MGQFILPSGRIVETQEPTYGQEVHIISVGLKDGPEEYTYLKFDAIVPGLTREEIASLSRKDGRALAQEVSRIFDGRQEKEEVPFGNGLRRASRA